MALYTIKWNNMTTVNRREYGKALSTYGFNYHNVIRYRRDSGIDKVSKRQ